MSGTCATGEEDQIIDFADQLDKAADGRGQEDTFGEPEGFEVLCAPEVADGKPLVEEARSSIIEFES